jgi:hypothetical protein
VNALREKTVTTDAQAKRTARAGPTKVHQDDDADHAGGLEVHDDAGPVAHLEVGVARPDDGARDAEHGQDLQDRDHPRVLGREGELDEAGRDDGEAGRERGDDEQEAAEREEQALLAVPVVLHVRERGDEDVAHLLGDEARRDVGEVVGEVVEAGAVLAEVVGEDEVVELGRPEAGDGADRHG